VQRATHSTTRGIKQKIEQIDNKLPTKKEFLLSEKYARVSSLDLKNNVHLKSKAFLAARMGDGGGGGVGAI